MRRKIYPWFELSVFSVIVACGCSGKPPMGDVKGTVTVNGEPLSEGAVRFIPVNGNTPTTGGTIRDGKFRVTVPVSKQRVEISANVIDREKTPPHATNDQIVMKKLVPAQY
ncbi:MAG: hypothetical protein ACJ8LM_17785, partial [Candidatus Udaeobacter sp.]